MEGLDVGIAKLAMLSDDTLFEPVNRLKKDLAKLTRRQHEMSPKVTFSNHWKKAKRKVEKLHAHIKHSRRDNLHKGRKVANLSKSAVGTVNQPRRNVRARSGLNRSRLDKNFYELHHQLEYKQGWRGGHTAKANSLS